MPAVFTRVGDYMKWIEGTVSAYSGVDYDPEADVNAIQGRNWHKIEQQLSCIFTKKDNEKCWLA